MTNLRTFDADPPIVADDDWGGERSMYGRTGFDTLFNPSFTISCCTYKRGDEKEGNISSLCDMYLMFLFNGLYQNESENRNSFANVKIGTDDVNVSSLLEYIEY